MLNFSAHHIDTLIVGAGPYGLSVAAHLRETGVPFHIFGKAMQTWSAQMPEGMHLRSAAARSDLSGGSGAFPLTQFLAGFRTACAGPDASVAVEEFAAYGEEFARRFVPNLQSDLIKSIGRTERHFPVTTVGGERFLARRVILATGLQHMQHVPPLLRHLPASRVTHTSQHRSYREFSGRDVTVLGSGAGALNAAVLLHEAGAHVTLVARSRKLRLDAADPGISFGARQRSHANVSFGAGLRATAYTLAPDVCHRLPARLRRKLNAAALRPSGDRALLGRVHDFPVLLGCRLHAVEAADGGCGKLRLTLTDRDGAARGHLTSHLIAATGFRFEKHRLGVLSQSLREQIRLDSAGELRLSRTFETSVEGLYCIGPLATASFGPLQHTLAGTQFAAERVTEALVRNLKRESLQAERELVPRGSAFRGLTRRERVL